MCLDIRHVLMLFWGNLSPEILHIPGASAPLDQWRAQRATGGGGHGPHFDEKVGEKPESGNEIIGNLRDHLRVMILNKYGILFLFCSQ